MRQVKQALWLTLVTIVLSACQQSVKQTDRGDDNGRLIVTGSSTVAPLITVIGKRFEEQRPGVRVDVQTGGSSRGIADARRDLADIGMASRALADAERDLHGVTIARDGICVIVHRDNGITELSKQQLINIYTGAVTNWRQVGGHDAPITVVNKAEGRSTLELFLKYFGLKNAQIKALVIIGDNEQGIKTVAGNPDAIGYVSVGAAEFSVGDGVAIRALPMAGIPATSEAVESGQFPLSRPLTLVTGAPPTGLAKEFIDYVQSPDVHDIVRELNFVPVKM